MSGRAFTHVDLVPYDPRWPARFRRTATELRTVFPDAVIAHVGSTSVPGLSSKDTIDVAVGVPDVTDTLGAETITAAERLGFVFVPDSFSTDQDHSFLHRIISDHRTDHVHVLRIDAPGWEERLLFRDFLCANAAALRDYERAKQDLAARFAAQRDEYVEHKQEIVEQLMQRARLWSTSVGSAAGSRSASPLA